MVGWRYPSQTQHKGIIMYFGVYKDSGAIKKDFTSDTLAEAVESLVTVIEEGMERGEDITAGIYDLNKPEGKRLVVDYFSSNLGDSFTIIEATGNITRDELREAKVNFLEDGEGFLIIRQWEYES